MLGSRKGLGLGNGVCGTLHLNGHSSEGWDTAWFPLVLPSWDQRAWVSLTEWLRPGVQPVPLAGDYLQHLVSLKSASLTRR